MVKEEDKLYYVMWGLVFVLAGIATALWILGLAAYGVLVFFAGLGTALSLMGKDDPYKFYGGLGLIFIGILAYGFMAGLNIAYVLIALVVIIGLLFIWYAFGGEKNGGSKR